MKPILITGASGYIGGRLVPQLAERGYPVRCLARDPRKLSGRGWGDGVEVVPGDVLDRDSLAKALAGCGAAYYLVHSMAGGERGFAERATARRRGTSPRRPPRPGSSGSSTWAAWAVGTRPCRIISAAGTRSGTCSAPGRSRRSSSAPP